MSFYINEAAGIFGNVIDVAKKLTETIDDYFFSEFDDEDEIDFNREYGFAINNYFKKYPIKSDSGDVLNLKGLDVKINFNLENIRGFMFLNAAQEMAIDYNKKEFGVFDIIGDKVSIKFTFACGSERGFYKWFKSNRVTVGSVLAHELTHAIDNIFYPKRNAINMVNYNVNKEPIFLLINKINYYSYFLDRIERMSITAELMYLLKDKFDDKSRTPKNEQFKKLFFSEEIITKIIGIRGMTEESFYSDIRDEMKSMYPSESLDELLKLASEHDFIAYRERLINMFYGSITKHTIEKYGEPMYFSEIYKVLFANNNIEPETAHLLTIDNMTRNENIVKKFKSDIYKYDNATDFIRFRINETKRKADKLLKRLSKLYVHF